MAHEMLANREDLGVQKGVPAWKQNTRARILWNARKVRAPGCDYSAADSAHSSSHASRSRSLTPLRFSERAVTRGPLPAAIRRRKVASEIPQISAVSGKERTRLSGVAVAMVSVPRRSSAAARRRSCRLDKSNSDIKNLPGVPARSFALVHQGVA